MMQGEFRKSVIKNSHSKEGTLGVCRRSGHTNGGTQECDRGSGWNEAGTQVVGPRNHHGEKEAQKNDKVRGHPRGETLKDSFATSCTVREALEVGCEASHAETGALEIGWRSACYRGEFLEVDQEPDYIKTGAQEVWWRLIHSEE